MAYADYEFYTSTYCGDVLTEENATKWLTRASDEVDCLTFDRLATAFPTEERHAEKVKKAVCAIAEALFQINEQQQAAGVQRAADGTLRGAVASVSSGRESVSYSTGASGTSIAAAAANETERLRLLQGIAVRYLANVPDACGTNLLYAGVRKATHQGCCCDDRCGLIGGGC